MGANNLEQIDDCLVDEDYRNETSERLLSEASDVGYEKAEVKCDKHEEYDGDPEADPETKRQKLNFIISVQLLTATTNK